MNAAPLCPSCPQPRRVLPGDECRACGWVAPLPAPPPPAKRPPSVPDAHVAAALTEDERERGRVWVAAIRSELVAGNRRRREESVA